MRTFLYMMITLIIIGMSIGYCQQQMQSDTRIIVLIPVKYIDAADIALLFGGIIYSSSFGQQGYNTGQYGYNRGRGSINNSGYRSTSTPGYQRSSYSGYRTQNYR